MNCACTTEIDACMTYGTYFQQDVELEDGFEDAAAEGYQGRMTLLDYEGGTALMTAISPIAPDNTMSFSFTNVQTATLPPYDLWYTVDIFRSDDLRRLYQGDLEMNL